MSGTRIPVALRRLVEERARHHCEYCLLPAAVAFFPHEVDHVIAEKHGGTTVEANLAFTCWRCNRHIRHRPRLHRPGHRRVLPALRPARPAVARPLRRA